jgi:hypothetical protein
MNNTHKKLLNRSLWTWFIASVFALAMWMMNEFSNNLNLLLSTILFSHLYWVYQLFVKEKMASHVNFKKFVYGATTLVIALLLGVTIFWYLGVLNALKIPLTVLTTVAILIWSFKTYIPKSVEG